MGKTAAKRARVRPMHVIMLPMKSNWSSEIVDQKELSAVHLLRWMIILWPCLSSHGCLEEPLGVLKNLAIPLVVGGEISV